MEMVFVLGMVAVLVTWLTLTIGTVETEDRLRRSAGDIESLAKRARSIAVQQQRPYKLTISEESLSIEPLNHLSDDEGGFVSDADDSESRGFEDVIASEETDPDVQLEIKRWQSDEWIVIEDDKEVILRLDPNGLVEPISIRCSYGESWIIQELHPLTADVRDEQMTIEKE